MSDPTPVNESRRRLLTAVGWSGALAVLLGAFGAHALAGQLPPERLSVFDTASRYHFVHTLALGLVALLPDTRTRRWAARGFGWGLIVFCGSLYVLATRGLLGLEGASWLGAVTPLGGLAFVAGWVALALSARRLAAS